MDNMEERQVEGVKRYGKYRRNSRWIVKKFVKYIRKLWNDVENMEENCEWYG